MTPATLLLPRPPESSTCDHGQTFERRILFAVVHWGYGSFVGVGLELISRRIRSPPDGDHRLLRGGTDDGFRSAAGPGRYFSAVAVAA